MAWKKTQWQNAHRAVRNVCGSQYNVIFLDSLYFQKNSAKSVVYVDNELAIPMTSKCILVIDIPWWQGIIAN